MTIQSRWKRLAFNAAATLLATAAAILVAMDVYYWCMTATPTNLEASGLTPLVFGGTASVQIRLFDSRSDAPHAGIPVKVTVFDRPNRRLMELAVFSTDASGAGNPTFRVKDLAHWPDGEYTLVVASGSYFNKETTAHRVALRRPVQPAADAANPPGGVGPTTNAPVADSWSESSYLDKVRSVALSKERAAEPIAAGWKCLAALFAVVTAAYWWTRSGR